jgi:tRNA nucleotidyltransferase/poly(A) polymerase
MIAYSTSSSNIEPCTKEKTTISKRSRRFTETRVAKRPACEANQSKKQVVVTKSFKEDSKDRDSTNNATAKIPTPRNNNSPQLYTNFHASRQRIPRTQLS